MISTFRSALDPRPVADQSLAEIHARIVGPELAASTAAIRAETDHDKRSALKRLLPGVVFAGSFAERRKTAWKTASGLLVCDFDQVPDLARLRTSLSTDPVVALLFISPSGNGIKAVIRVPVGQPDPEQHARAFAAAECWAREVHGAELDQSGKDHSRLCFLASDPAAMLNLAAVPLDLARWAPAPEPTRTPPPPRAERVEPGDLLRRAARYIDALPPSISGENGHAALLRAAVSLVHGFDLSDADALPLLEQYNARAIPPWEPRDLLRKLAEARRIQHREPLGWLRDASRPEQPKRSSEGQPRMHVDVDSEVSVATSEAAIAAALAESNLCARLRWRGGADSIWCEWSGRSWEPSGDKLPLSLQAAVRRAVASALDARAIDPNVARRLESAGSVRGIASMLSAWPSMRLAVEIDPPGLLAMPRGVLDLDSGALLAHDPARPITKACPVDPEGGNPLWELVRGHLEACLGEAYTPMRRYLGASLIGRPADRKFLWFVGVGQDGKSTLARILKLALGQHVASVPAEALAADARRGAHGHELASGLMTCRLAIASEVPSNVNWPLIKSLTGGDAITSKRLHGRAFTIDRPPHLVVLSNVEPVAPDQASADRLLVCRLKPVVEPSDDLARALATPGPERDGIAASALQWLLEGAAEFQSQGLGPCPRFGGEVAPGLAGWWTSSVAAGLLLPGRGLASLSELRPLAAEWCRLNSMPEPTDRELASFLRSVVATKHVENGNRYRVGLKATEPKKPSSTHTRENTVSTLQVPSGSPTPGRTIVI